MHLPYLLTQGKLIRRYKRFLADVELPSGEVIVAHCPNPGTMIGCADPGSAILLRHSDDPNRKLPYTWVMTVLGDVHITVDTLLANKIVAESLKNKQIPELREYDQVIPEFKWGNSRFDFCLRKSDQSLPDCLLEVKSTTLAYGNRSMFPDAKTERGRKHLDDLINARAEGLRAVQFYCVSRNDVESFSPADHIDIKYGTALRRAHCEGVEIIAWRTAVTRDGDLSSVQLVSPIAVVLE